MEKCPELVDSESLDEIVCFRYQRMMRYRGMWHLEKRTVLPGHIFLSGTKVSAMEKRKPNSRGTEKEKYRKIFLEPCEIPYLKEMCQEKDMVCMSKGIIRDGKVIVTSGPLKEREDLIRKIDRHKRTADIEIPFAGERKRVTVGLEIYEKQ